MKPVKLVKIVAGCCLALAVSEAIGLRFATSSVIPAGIPSGWRAAVAALSPPQWQSPA